MDKLMSVGEVCQTLGLSPRTVAKYVKLGKIKSFKVFNSRRFREEDIKKLIDKCAR